MSPEQRKLDNLRIDRTERRERKSGAWVVVVIAALALIAAAGWWLSRPTPAKVRTATVRESTGLGETAVLNASGYVTARRKATVSSKITGKVVEVLIEEGVEVTEGQVLARLDSSNVGVALSLTEAELEAGRSALAETRVRLEEARLELRRVTELVAGGVASQAELDGAQAEVDSLKARLVRQSDEVEVAKRQVALRLQELEDTVIRAPFAGKVVSKNAQPGEMISPISAGGGFTRTGIGTIVDMASLEIEVDVSESYINRVRPNQPVKATLDAYPEWKIPARVIAIIPTADRDKATVRVRVAFEELDPRILPDMGVKVAFLGEEAAAADARSPILLIPRAALRAGNGRDIVFVVGNGRVEQRAVTVMGAQTGEVQVVSGLSAGEKVVVEGPRDLADGDRVEEVIG